MGSSQNSVNDVLESAKKKKNPLVSRNEEISYS